MDKAQKEQEYFLSGIRFSIFVRFQHAFLHQISHKGISQEISVNCSYFLMTEWRFCPLLQLFHV